MNMLALDGYHCFLSDDRGHLLEILEDGSFFAHLDHYPVEIFYEGLCCADCLKRVNEHGFVKRFKILNGGALVKHVTVRLLVTEDVPIPSKVIYLHAMKSMMQPLFLHHQNKFLKNFLVHKLANFLQQLMLSHGMMELQGTFEYLEYQMQILEKMSLVSFLSRSFSEVSRSAALDEMTTSTTLMSARQLVQRLVQDLDILFPQLSVVVLSTNVGKDRALPSLYRMILLTSLLDMIEETKSTGGILTLSVTASKSHVMIIDLSLESKDLSPDTTVKAFYSCKHVKSLEDIRCSGLILASYLLKQLGGNVLLRVGKNNELLLTYMLPQF